MDDEFRFKSLKLLADPHKFKHRRRVPNIDSFKASIESRFNYSLDDMIYQRINKLIRTELIVHSILVDIINQVSLDHSP